MKEKFLFLLLVSLAFLFLAVACSDDEELEGGTGAYCNSNVDCTRDSYCDLENPRQDDDLGTLVYYCKKRQICSTQADCPMNWKCKISEGFCITSREADGVMCRSNDDCQDPYYPVCNLANGECEPSGGEGDTSDEQDISDSGDAGSDDTDAVNEDDADTASDDDEQSGKVGEIFMSDDFEAGDANWTIIPAEETAPCWEIGVPASGPKAAHSGEKAAATILGGEYPDNCNDLLKYGSTVKIPSEGMPEISFYAWVDLVGGGNSPYDYVEVLVKKDGEMWETTSGLYLTADTPSSQTAALDNSRTKITKELGTAYYKFTGDLSAYKGQSVEIGFRFVSDGSDHKDGLYLDDIELSY